MKDWLVDMAVILVLSLLYSVPTSYICSTTLGEFYGNISKVFMVNVGLLLLLHSLEYHLTKSDRQS